MNFDITDVLKALIVLAVTLITTFLIPWIKSKITAAQWNFVKEAVIIAVAAAEQLFPGGGRGAQKLEWVHEQLKAQGIDYDKAEVYAAIEAAVHALKK